MFEKREAVSVIIPVWNPGPGIDRCIASLRRQTLKEIEMIFVDDCGTDDAMAKVRLAAREDPRIRIIENPENLGAGPSQNRGIEAARGIYFSFVDPDDYIADDFLERLYETASSSRADIAKGRCVYLQANGAAVQRPRELIDIIRQRLAAGWTLFAVFTYEHWSAIYHSRLFEDGTVRYGITRHDQDTLFLLRACLKTENVVLCGEALYFFVERGDSAMHRLPEDGWDDMAAAFEAQVESLLRLNAENAYACVYTAGRLENMIKRCRAFQDDPLLKNGYRDFKERIRRTVLPLPFVDSLRGRYFSVEVFLDHGVCLPNDVYALPWNKKPLLPYFRLAADHLRFAFRHPRYFGICIRRIFSLSKKAAKAAAQRLIPS